MILFLFFFLMQFVAMSRRQTISTDYESVIID